MPKTSEITVPCGNRYCDNKAAKVDQVCGNIISETDPNCDYLNYEAPRSVYSISLSYLLPRVPDELKQDITEFEEIDVDLQGLKSIKDAVTFLRQSPEADDYGSQLSDYLASLLISWGSTFGIASELNPDSSESEGPKFVCIELAPQGDEIQAVISVGMHLKSHQSDMLEWYPESLAETLMDEEDLIWIHEGTQITLLNVEVG
jgi:hypothetical protein